MVEYYRSGNSYRNASRVSFLLVFAALVAVPSMPSDNPGSGVAASESTQATSLSTLLVTKLADTNDGSCDSDCSLREALAASEPNAIISFASGLTGKIKLGSTLAISRNVLIAGPDNKTITISGDNEVRVLYIDSGILFTIKNMTVSGGRIRGERGSNGEECERGENGGTADGGGLYSNGGTVTIINSTFSDNRAEGGKGGKGGKHSYDRECGSRQPGSGGVGRGGALFSTGTVILINSTFSDNRAIGGDGGNGGGLAARGGRGGQGMGGALCATGPVVMVNSTFSDNRALGGKGGRGSGPGRPGPYAGSGADGQWGDSIGGAIYSSYNMWVSNSTLANNRTWSGDKGDPYAGVGSGGAIYSAGKFIIQNSLIAGSASGGNCSGSGSVYSGGYNLDSDGTCNLTASGDLSKINPKIESLKNNGGKTSTHALKSGSPAIDGGNPAGCTDHEGEAILTDQRGSSRPWGERCDIGAFEFSR